MPRLRVLSISLQNANFEDDERVNAGEEEGAPLRNDLQQNRALDFPEWPWPNERVVQIKGKERQSRLCLGAVSKAAQLEHLQLISLTIRGGDLSRLAPLDNLRSLSLIGIRHEGNEASAPPLLSDLPIFERLGAVEVGSDGYGHESKIGDDDLPYLARLPRLRSLRLKDTDVTGAGIAKLTPRDSLEELSLWGRVVSSSGIETLLDLKNVQKLHLDGEYKQPSAPSAARNLSPKT